MKRIICLCVFVLVCSALCIGCTEKEDLPVDYSEYAFAGHWWTRDAEHDEETIYFGENGRFTYYCGCGNPVNDSDMCEGYTYDDETKTIELDCFDTSDELITLIKVVKCDDNELHLDFNGEIRVFTK